jgi:hypothetical protein
MFRQAATGLALAALVLTAGCSTHTHVVGTGAQEWEAQSERQWYVAFGLAELNEVDTATMAAGIEDYEITTEQTFVDGIIGALTGGIITARTVTVTK